jgi:hypothetical protein
MEAFIKNIPGSLPERGSLTLLVDVNPSTHLLKMDAPEGESKHERWM